MDVSQLTFSRDHAAHARARDAGTGLRLILLACAASAIAFILLLLPAGGHGPSTAVAALCVALGLAAAGCGAYGSYLTATAVGWASWITAAVVLGALLPYLKLVFFAVLAVQALTRIRAAGYAFSLWGPLRRTAG
ncbi:hypothetical protein [Xanthomonas maliensis]|uniref:hypothetical protein n=1 Tax=Xanthomonas maliensis TaxID=1321368 RepID=UPI00039F445C|nr:hypothetical protein [Xanthomonas maliensis]KAB7762487.1 hypothetical protein CKY51_21300 [Xanthomonas maliensis]